MVGVIKSWLYLRLVQPINIAWQELGDVIDKVLNEMGFPKNWKEISNIER